MTESPQQSLRDDPQRPTTDPPDVAARRTQRPLEQLRRSRTDRKIAGVAGGLARHLDVDPTVVRVVLVVLCFFGGAGFVVYGAVWALVPEDGSAHDHLGLSPSTRTALLVAAGVVALLLLLGDGWGFGLSWPLLVVGLGVLAYLMLRDRGGATRVTGPSSAGPPSAPSHGAPSYGPPPSDPASVQAAGPAGGAPAPPVPSDDDDNADGPGTASWAEQPPPWVPVTAAGPPPPPPRGPRGPLLFGLTLALVAVASGVLGLVDVSGHAVSAAAYPALALTVVGAMLVLGSVVGRAGGLIALGLVAVVALVATSAVGAVGGVDQQDTRLHAVPTSARDVQNSYFVPGGRVVVDLSALRDPEALAGRTVDVGARTGELVVVLPKGIETRIDARITGPGQIDLPLQSAGGFGLQATETDGSDTGGEALADAGPLLLDVHLFAGHIEVRTTP
ncbi:MAG: PspC domain-containing protein [Nocardioidaceae bacterium]